MNEKVDLTKILKNCPKGFKLYSPMVGEVEFERILDGIAYPIITSYNERTLAFTNKGFYYDDAGAEAECLLFPSAEQRDWRKFKAPWYKKEMDINSMSNKDDERLRKTAIAFLKDFAEQGYENAVECIDWLKKQGEQKKQVHFPKFTFDDILALQCCMVTVKNVQEDNELYEQLNLIHNKMYDAYRLEKQGETSSILSNSSNNGKNEQTPADKIEPKFKVGDWLCANELNDYANLIKIVKIVDVFGKKMYKISRDYDSDLDLTEFDFIEKHYHLWNIQDAKDGDVLADEDNNIGIFQECEGMYWYSYTYLGFDGQLRGFSMGGSHEQTDTHPATKEQRDALMKAMNDAGYEWDAEKKELKKLVEPKFKVGDKLVQDKFDPKTLQVFDKVLVRDYDDCKWMVDFYSYKEVGSGFPYRCVGSIHKYCIPYNDDTACLVGTKDEPSEFYRYWED